MKILVALLIIALFIAFYAAGAYTLVLVILHMENKIIKEEENSASTIFHDVEQMGARGDKTPDVRVLTRTPFALKIKRYFFPNR